MKLRRTWILISIVAVMATGHAGFFAQQTNPETTKDAAALRAAIDKETVQGDRKGAIEQYKKIAQSSKDRSIAVKALLQLAELYRKAGEADAQKIYQQIVRDYKDQKNAVELAQAKLGITAAADPVSRTVWKLDSPQVSGGRISSDGRFFSWTDRRDIFVHDIATGEDRNLTNQPKESKDAAWESVISPDGKRIVYNWGDQKTRRYELRIANLTGDPAPRKFYSNPDASDMWLEAWSPDGKVLAIVLERPDRTRQIALISASDGSLLGVLKTVNWQGIRVGNNMAFSPDSRYLAYDAHDASSGIQAQVTILAVDGSGESFVSRESDDQEVMGWSPDGKWLLYSSDRVGDRGIYAAAFANGAIHGAPQRLAPGMALRNVNSLGVSSSGTLYYQTVSQNQVRGIGVGSMDYSSGRFSVAALASNSRETVEIPNWSPDGKSFAYYSYTDDGEKLSVRSIEQTGSVRTVRPTRFRDLLPLRWIRGSRSLLVSGSDLNSGQNNLYRVDTETGEVSPVPGMHGVDFFPRSAHVLPDGESFLIRIATGSKTGVYRVNARTGERSAVFIDADGEASVGLRLSRDGDRLFMIRGFEQTSNRVVGGIGTGPTALIARDLRAGSEKELVRLPRLGDAEVAGDGRNVATTSVDTTSNSVSLVTVPTTGGPVRELLRVVYQQPGSAEGTTLQHALTVVGWTPDNLSVLVRKNTREIRTGQPSVATGSELWMVPIAGGEPRKIEGSAPAGADLSGMVLSPDGVHFLLPIVRSEPRSVTFSALENFLPKVTTASK
jgi:Tol biopolymer transport system component